MKNQQHCEQWWYCPPSHSDFWIWGLSPAETATTADTRNWNGSSPEFWSQNQLNPLHCYSEIAVHWPLLLFSISFVSLFLSDLWSPLFSLSIFLIFCHSYSVAQKANTHTGNIKSTVLFFETILCEFSWKQYSCRTAWWVWYQLQDKRTIYHFSNFPFCSSGSPHKGF